MLLTVRPSATFRAIVVAAAGAIFGATHLPFETAMAASFTVGCGPTGVTELIAAINSANATAADDVITMTTPDCVYTLLAQDNATAGGNGLPVVVSAATAGTLTINGNRATIARDGTAASFRLLYVNAGADLTLNDLTVMGGLVTGYGGGIHNSGTLTIHRGTISNNSASISGGGILNEGTLRALDSAVTGNSASLGGGISAWLASAATILTNTTIAGNVNLSSGGGLYIAETSASVVITSCSIVNNGGDFGGGMSNFGSVTMRNTIVAGNRQDFNRVDFPVTDCGGFGTYSGDYNLFGSGTGCSGGANSIFVNPHEIFLKVVSQALASNGGTTETLALLPGSNALGRGNVGFLSEATTSVDYNGDGDLDDVLATDQRGPGHSRVAGTAVDIGAYESGCPASPYTVAASNTGDLVFAIDCSNTNGPGTDDVLALADSTYLLQQADNGTAGGNGLPSIVDTATAGTLTINGNGASVVRESGAAFRIFHVSSGANLTIDTLTVSGGASDTGGGMYNDGAVTLINSTLSANAAGGTGGAVHNNGTLTLTNSTISGNTADNGGGVYQASGTLVATNCTLASNSAVTGGGGVSAGGGSLTVRNTIIAGNQAAGSATNSMADCNATAGGDYNLYGAGTGCAIGANSVTTDPATVMTIVLDPTLSYHSGGTKSHSLRGGSPAIDAGNDSFLDEATTGVDYNGDDDTGDVLATDQRGAGFPRVVSTAVDIGSFETQVACPTFPYTVAAGDTPGLIHAIACANANDTNDVIELTDSTYLVTHVNEANDGDNGLPSIAAAATAGTLTIHGNGSTVSRKTEARMFRLFRMEGDAHLILDDVTLTGGSSTSNGGTISNANGTLALTDTVVSNSYSAILGGAIYSGGGSLTLTRTAISSANAGSSGGGIYSAGTLTLSSTTVIDSGATSTGGGIYSGGAGVISGGAISGNSISAGFLAPGGGIYNAGTLTITGTIVSSNVGGRGAGIFNANTITLIDVTLSDNSATRAAISENFGGGLSNFWIAEVRSSRITNNLAEHGAGIYTQGVLTVIESTVADNTASFASGGGIYNEGSLRVDNSTVAGNTTAFNGGGIRNGAFAAASVVTNSTIVDNRAGNAGGGISDAAGSLTMNNSIIAGNQAMSSSTNGFADCGGAFNGDYNLYGTSTGCASGSNSVTVDPAVVFTEVIEPAPANHGGPTPAYMLRSGSPAIDAGSNDLAVDSNGDPLTTDQRGAGFPRPIAGTVDVGALEWPVPDLSATKTVSGTFVAGQTVTYVIVITNSGLGAQEDSPGDELTDVLPGELTPISATASSGTAIVNVPTRTVGWNGGVPAGGSVTITLAATLNAGVVAGTLVSNQGTIHYDADANGTNEASRATDDPAAAGTGDATAFVVAPTPAPNLSATKTVSGTFGVGETITYTVTIANSGSGEQEDNADDEFTDVLPGELTLVSATATIGTALADVPTGTVIWNGAIPVGGSVTITITATLNAGVAPGTSIANQGTIQYDADADGTNESSRVTDDPAVAGTDNATAFVVSAAAQPAAIPTLDPFALVALALMLAIVAVAMKR